MEEYSEAYFQKRDLLDLHIADSIRLLARKAHAKKILDVGCGSGQIVSYLQKCGLSAFGCDISPQAIKFSKRITRRNTVLKAPATKLPYKSKSFDLVSNISMIEHISQIDGIIFLREAYRVLRPGGCIFIITPNFNSPLRYVLGTRWFGYSDPTHIYFYTPASLRFALKSVGFKNISYKIPTIKIKSDLHIPNFLKWLPQWAKQFLTYLMISSPLSTWRDSFWIVAYKGSL